MKLSPKEIYETLRNLDEDQNIESIPEIHELIMRFEDAISCIINTPEKLNPTLPYNLQLIISNLIDVLKNPNNHLRKSQIASIMSIIDFMISGETRGLIKLPTGAGKTRLFTEIVSSLSLPTVIMVPKINLKGQTSEYFEGENVFNIGENGTVIQDVTRTLQVIREKNIINPIIIITYQSFVRLKEDQKLFQEFSQMIKVVIRDEAHRSLGDKTQEALSEMHAYDDEVDEEILVEQDKDLLETDVLSSNEKLELLFTATPNLLDKSVRDAYEEIFGLRIQDLVEEGVLHMPQFIQVSEAHIDIGDQNLGERILNQFATKFINQNHEFTYSEITNKYLELKNANNGYLPAVGFCRDIAHAEFMKQYLEERGQRAIRVTSSNASYDAGVPEDEAKRMIESNEVDVVLTVTKISEGWDVPTLRCALNFAPILSEAKYIQGVGRVLRTFDYQKNGEGNETNGVHQKNYAYVIEPKFWNISSSGGEKNDGEGTKGGEERDKNLSKKITKISGITHFIDSGEFDIGYLSDLYGDLDEYGQIITPEEVLEFFKTKSFGEWVGLKNREIYKIEFKGRKIRNLVTIAGWDNPNDIVLHNPSGFQEFIAWVFSKEVKNIDKEEVLKFFRTQTYEEWLTLKKRSIIEIEFQGKKITSLATLAGWNNPKNLPVNIPSGFQEFIAWVFSKEVNKEAQALEFFKTQTYEEWINLSAKDINKIEFQGRKIVSITTLAGWNNPENLQVDTPSGFQEFIAWVFGKELEILTKEKVLEFFKTHTYEEWINLSAKDINKIEFQGKKIRNLATIAGWMNPNNVSIQTPSGFQEFIAWVFKKESEIITKEKVLEFFKMKTFKEWIKFKQKDISKIEFKEKKIMNLTTLAGWNNPNNVSIQTPSGFQEFIAWVFGKEIKNITQEEVLRFFKTQTFNEWIQFTRKDIRKIKFQGRKIVSITTLAGWNNPENLQVDTPSGFQEFIAWVFEQEKPGKKI